jgi:hypothetical protein
MPLRMARLLHSRRFARLIGTEGEASTTWSASRLKTARDKATDSQVKRIRQKYIASMADLNLTGPVNGSVAPQGNEVRTRTPDRRCSRRIAFVLPIEVQGESPFNTRTVRGTTQNLSANGMSFVCSERYLAGQLLYITLRFGDQVQGADSFSLTLQFRVQRLEQRQRNDPEQFAVAVALDI